MIPSLPCRTLPSVCRLVKVPGHLIVQLGGKRGASGPGSVSSGQTASASCFGEMVCRGLGGGALALLPEASATPIGPDDSREESGPGECGTSTRRAVGAAALVLWEASPLRRRNASRSSPPLQ
jgi:hypothetical protein